MDDRLQINLDWIINNEQIRANTRRVRDDIEGVGQTAESVNRRVNTNIARVVAPPNMSQFQNSINQMTRELPAFTYSVQTGFMALSNNIPIFVDQLNNMRVANAALVASGGTAIPIWKQLVSGIFSWSTALSVAITLTTVFGKEIANFFSQIFKGKAIIDAYREAQESLAKQMGAVGEAAGKATLEVDGMKQKFQLAKDGVITKTSALKAYNDGLGKTLGFTKDFNTAEERTIKNGDAYIELMFKKARAVAIMKLYTEQMAKAAEAMAKTDDQAGSYILSGTKGKGIKTQDGKDMFEANAQFNRETEAKPFEQMGEQFKTMWLKANDDAAKFAKSHKLSLDEMSLADMERDQNAYQNIINSRKDMLDKIKALDDEYAGKRLTSDEAEQAELKNKFADFRKLIEQENRKIKDYNDKHPIKIGMIDASSVNGIETGAMKDLVYRQQTAGFKRSMEDQKKDYEQFEDYKAVYGEVKAKERFKNQINTEKTFMQLAEDEMSKLLDKDPVNMTGPEKQRLEMFAKFQQEAELAETSRLDKALQDFQGYAEKRLDIQVKAMEKAKYFQSKGYTDQAAQAMARGAEEVTELDKKNVEKWASYKRLFDGVGVLSRRQTLIAIAEFEKELKAADLTTDARMQLQQKINKLKGSVNNGSAKEINEIAQSLGKVANEFSKIDNNIGSISSTLLTAVQSYVEVQKGLSDIKDPEKSTTEKIGAGLGIVGAVMSVGNAVFGYFKGLKAAKEAAWKAMDDYQSAAMKGEHDYQALLRQREINEVKRNKNSYKAIIDQLELLKSQSPEIEAAYNKIFASLQGQESVSGVGYQHGTWLRKAKTWDIMASLSGSDYAKLEQLYMQGKLKDQAKADFESLKSLKEELEAVGLSVEDLQEQLNELLTGTTVGGLADSLAALFQNGKTMAADFGQSFESIMRNAVVNSFKVKFLQDQLTPFFSQLGELMKSGTPTEDQIAALKAQYMAIGAQGAEQWKQLEKIFGISLTDQSGDSSSGVTGTIKREITEQTGSEIVGLTRSVYDILKRHYNNGTATLTEVRQQTLYQKEIANNTASSVVELQNAVKELKDINKNTKPGSTGYDRGLG